MMKFFGPKTTIEGLDAKTSKAVLKAVKEFVDSSGLTIGDVAKLIPLDDEHAFEIASSEISRYQSQKEQTKADQLAKDFDDVRVIKTWQTCNDDLVCKICGPLNGVNVLHNKEFRGSDGKFYKHPPAHVGCRCWMSATTDIIEEAILQSENDEQLPPSY